MIDLGGVPPSPLLCVMGVSAVGKSTVGRALGIEFGVPFLDADDLHPRENVAKMASGVPLDDSDRMPWLDAVGTRLRDADGGMVVACSALRRRYRDRLRASTPTLAFVHLQAPRTLLMARATARTGHFMPATLLDSQFATLEELADDELGVTLGVERRPDELVAMTRAWWRTLSAGGTG